MDNERSALIRRIQERDQQALRLLYDRLSPLVYTLIVRIIDDSAEAEEVLAETFWQVWDGAASYDVSRGSVEGWVITLARSRAIDRLRARRRQEATRAAYESDHAAPTPSYTPEMTALQSEQSRAVVTALNTLPAEQRLAIELAYYQGLSQAEIAQRLAEPLGTIKTRLRLGLVRLRTVLPRLLGAHP